MLVCQNNPVFGNENPEPFGAGIFSAPTLPRCSKSGSRSELRLNIEVVVAVVVAVMLTTAKEAIFIIFTRFSSLEKNTIFSLIGTSLGTNFSTTLLMV